MRVFIVVKRFQNNNNDALIIQKSFAKANEQPQELKETTENLALNPYEIPSI